MKKKVARSAYLCRMLEIEDSKGTLTKKTSERRSKEVLKISVFAISKLDEIEHHLSDERKAYIKSHQGVVKAKASRSVKSDFKSTQVLGPTLEFPKQLLDVLDQELNDLKKRLSK